MRKSFYILFTIVIISLAAGCVKNNNHSLRDDARSLYTNSVVLVRKYTDSIARAKDSTTVLSLFKRYDDALTKLNYRYAAEADYEISEGENDTLTNMAFKLVSLKDSMLYSFAQRPMEPEDSTITLISQEPQSN